MSKDSITYQSFKFPALGSLDKPAERTIVIVNSNEILSSIINCNYLSIFEKSLIGQAEYD